MFFVFGWGRTTTSDEGPTVPLNCPNCKNDTWYHLVAYRRWFTLFFIPVVPYSNHTMLVCPVCSAGLELKGAAADNAYHINQAAQQFLAEEIEEAEYTRLVEETPVLT